MTLRYLISPEERRKKLKKLLENKKIVRGIEAHNALSALISNDLKVEIEREGIRKINEFDFFWESSLTDSASKGHPDIEVVSFDSRLKTISEIFEVTNKPMIVDGDTGGDIHHFEYLIPKLERLGVSAVIIEDKIFPKRNSLDPGSNQEQEDPDRFADKIRAGKQIQHSDDFMIIARIESLIAGKDLNDAIFRAKKYLEAGVDGIMIHSKSPDSKEILKFSDEYKRICNELNLKKPLVSVPTTYNSIYESELAEKGFNIVIYANHMLRAAYKSMEEVGKIILKNERSFEADPHIVPIEEIFNKVGFYDVKEKDILMDKTPSVIIPAAGENPEMSNLLKDLPKPLLRISDKTLLEHQTSLFRKMGLNDINLITGFNKEKFDTFLNKFENPDYDNTGVMYSLMKAKEKMKKGFIYLNSDLIVDEKLVRELLERKEDIIIIVDNTYLYHEHNIDKKLDAVVTKRGKDGFRKLRYFDDEAMMIGKNIPKEIMTHEYVGIAKFSKNGAESLIKIYEDLEEKHQGPFHEAESFKKANDTDFFQEMINRGYKISVHETNGGWIEIHNEKDIEIARKIIDQFYPK